MAAKKKKSTVKKNPKTVKRVVADDLSGEVIQMTIRIPPAVKKHLHAHAAFRAADEGRIVSYNRALLDLILGARVR